MATRLRLEGPNLAGLLARVSEEHGPGARIVAADRVRNGGVAGFFARESYAVTVELDESPPPPARAVDAPGSLLELADEINAAEATEERVALGTGAMAGTAAAVRRPAGVPVLSTDSAHFADILARWASTAGEAPATDARPAQPPARPEAGGSASHGPDQDIKRSQLAALGVPAEIAAAVAADPDGGLWDKLVRALDAALPPVPEPDCEAGDVLVVAGPAAVALDLARTLAVRLRLDPAAVLLAAPSDPPGGVEDILRIPGPAAARRRAGALRRAEVATVVAVDAPCDGRSAEWARDVADALGARTTWAVVDATTKPGDVADHLSGLGRVDGIAVRSTAATRDPAAVLRPALDLGVPTVWLDDRPGDAYAWATLLSARVLPAQRGRHRRAVG